MSTDPNNRIEIRRIQTGKEDVGKCYPLTVAITITENCGSCDWCVKGAMGRKLSCGHPRIQAARPYVDNVDGISRAVVAENRPDWCPL